MKAGPSLAALLQLEQKKEKQDIENPNKYGLFLTK